MSINRRLLLLSPAVTLPLLSTARGEAQGSSGSTRATMLLSSFGAKLDGIADDSAALQRAVDACLTSAPACPLVIDGVCRVERPVYIDRRVDRTRGVFRIIGSGAFGGFVVAGNFALFDSRLLHASQPTSEHIWFQSIRFERTPSAPLATALSDKFLRVQFHECEFEAIKVLNADRYAQEWHFSRCIAQRWPGAFFSSHGGYHIISQGGKYQNGGGAVFNIVDPTLNSAGCVGCSFHQDVTESNSGSFIRAAVVQGLSVAGLYSEGNHGPTLDFDNAAPNRGISVTGSMFARKDEDRGSSDLFDIRWGRIEAGHAAGNYSTGRLHLHRSSTDGELHIAGDFAILELVRRAA